MTRSKLTLKQWALWISLLSLGACASNSATTSLDPQQEPVSTFSISSNVETVEEILAENGIEGIEDPEVFKRELDYQLQLADEVIGHITARLDERRQRLPEIDAFAVPRQQTGVVLTVTTRQDVTDPLDGQLSFREALADAQPGDRIEFNTFGTIEVDEPLVVDKDLFIIGNNKRFLSIASDTTPMVLRVTADSVDIANLTFVGGNIDLLTPNDEVIGLIENEVGNLRLENVDISEASSFGLLNSGSVVLSGNSAVIANPFGGVVNDGTLVLTETSTITQNGLGLPLFNSLKGAAAVVNRGTMTMQNNSTLETNNVGQASIINLGNLIMNDFSAVRGNLSIFNSGILNQNQIVLNQQSAIRNGTGGLIGGLLNDEGSSIFLNDESAIRNNVGGSIGGIYNVASASITLTGGSAIERNVGNLVGGLLNEGDASLISIAGARQNIGIPVGGVFNSGTLFLDPNSQIASNVARIGGVLNNGVITGDPNGVQFNLVRQIAECDDLLVVLPLCNRSSFLP